MKQPIIINGKKLKEFDNPIIRKDGWIAFYIDEDKKLYLFADMGDYVKPDDRNLYGIFQLDKDNNLTGIDNSIFVNIKNTLWNTFCD